MYSDFELTIAHATSAAYPVEVLHSPAGELPHPEVMHLPFSEDERRAFLADLPYLLIRSTQAPREQPFGEEHKIREFGARLFDALLAGAIGNLYRTSQALLLQKGLRMRLKLRLRPAELALLPWEFLFDKELGDYVCLAHQTAIVRYLETPQPPRALAVDPPLRLLAMVASPLGGFQFDLDEERRRLAEALHEPIQRGQVHLKWVEGQTLHDLQSTLRTQAWHAFYFVGHGAFDAREGAGYILLSNADGSAAIRVSANELSRLLDGAQDSLRFVVLNACRSAQGSERDAFSSIAARLTQRGMPAVLAMQSWLSEPAANAFMSEFFSQLAEELPIDAALTEARKMVCARVGRTLEWGTPALYMRAPDGVLFQVQHKSVSVEDDLLTAFGDMEHLKQHKRRAQE